MPINAAGLSNVFIRATRPPETFQYSYDPTPYNALGFVLLDLWLNTDDNTAWILVSLKGNNMSKGQVAQWVQITTGGTVVSVGAGNNISITGSPTMPIVNVAGLVNHSVLLGNNLGAINSLANGSTGQVLTAQGAGNDPIWAANASGDVTTLHTQDGNNVTATAGVINLSGAHGLNTTGTVGPNTATVAINNAIVLGDLSVIAANSNALSATTGDINIAAGNLKLPAYNAAGTQGVIKFAGRRYVTTDAVGNQFFGLDAGNLTMTGTNNLIFGGNGLNVNTTGHDNLLVGNNIMTTNTGGNFNCIFGHGAYNIGTDASNAIFGNGAMLMATTASDNTILGIAACNTLVTGDNNVVVGFQGGTAWAGNESNNMILGPYIGIVSDNNTVRIGNSGSAYTRFFSQGIRGISTGVNDAVAVLIDSAGQLGTTSSSRTKKDNIVDMGSYSDIIRSLRPVVFNYKEHAPEVKSVGLIAEEVAVVSPNLVVYDKEGIPETVKYHDLVPMMLNEFQKHCKLIGELQAINTDLLNRIRLLEEYNIKRS